MTQGKLNDAAASYSKALVIKPDYANAHCNFGNVMREFGKLDEAALSYNKALTIRPDYSEAHSNLLFCLNYGSDVMQSNILMESLNWNRCHTSFIKKDANHKNDRKLNRRLRIGYVSPDLRKHSVCYFFEPLLSSHDESDIETFCYADVEMPDATTYRLEGISNHWRKTIGMDNETLADTIRNDGIDILVDLAGHSAQNRMLVFAYKPAPIQVSWLGYPNTTGLSAMDYRIVDAITDPENEICETLVHLPNGFLCYQPDASAPLPTSERPSGPVTFGNFNNSSKMSKSCIKLWALILTKMPEAQLLLKSKQFSDLTAQELVREQFESHGISSDRVNMLGRSITTEEHLDLYAKVDVCLDPFPYNGTTTTCEALWMGVPVVTLLGEHHRGRVGASILSRVGLGEYVADDVESYVSIAVGLAQDTPRLESLRGNLRQRMSPLCDAGSFARDMEVSYRSMWHKWCSDN
jgi:predicted O-linked N-acetylglucosamine transferase (SPINDLY family)